MITNDSFYSEHNEIQEFGFFNGNPLNHYTNGDTIPLAYEGQLLDIEAELAVVISKTGTSISIDEANSFIAGYLMFNDISDRSIQDKERLSFLGYQKSKYLNARSSYLVTDIDPNKFAIRALVNGEEVFTCSPKDILDFMTIEEQLVTYSNYGGLVSGEIIGLGTMAGGCLNELELPHLKSGDTATFIGNQGLGELTIIIE